MNKAGWERNENIFRFKNPGSSINEKGGHPAALDFHTLTEARAGGGVTTPAARALGWTIRCYQIPRNPKAAQDLCFIAFS
jgi:hypothetical protein